MKPLTVSRVRSLASALVELGQHRVAMLGVLHVDEVDDDDAAEIAQAQLARDDLRRLEVGLEDRVVEAAPPTKPPVLTSIVVSASVWSMIR